VPAEFDPRLSSWEGVRVVHCSSLASKRTGHAITERWPTEVVDLEATPPASII